MFYEPEIAGTGRYWFDSCLFTPERVPSLGTKTIVAHYWNSEAGQPETIWFINPSSAATGKYEVILCVALSQVTHRTDPGSRPKKDVSHLLIINLLVRAIYLQC